MRLFILLSAAAVFASVASPGLAGTTCDDYPTALFCEDFDSYCRDPGPYTPCAPGNESMPKLYAIWPKTSLEYRNTIQTCGADFDIEDNQQILVSVPQGGRINDMGDEAGQLGQATRSLVDPIVLNVIGGQVFKGLGIRGKWGNQYDQLVGTDESPVTISVMMSSGTKSAAGLRLSDGVIELALEETEPTKAAYLDREVTPADYITVGNPETADCLSCRSQCAAVLASRGMADDGRAPTAPWPSICQSYDARTSSSLCPDPADPDGPPIPCGPPYCPETPVDKIHTTLAFGAMAMLDPNPCHCENPPKPADCLGSLTPQYTWHGMEVDHLAFFDGWKWRILSSKIFDPVEGIPGVTGYGEFQLTDKFGWVTVTVKDDTVDIAYDSRQWVTYAGDHCNPDKAVNDTVIAAEITAPGSGYTSAPAVIIDPPASGRQATAIATITDGAVTAITITDVGTGYASAPAITIEPPASGTPATAAATLGGGAYLAGWVHSEAFGIPRKYLGGFNALRVGNPSSCELCTQELRNQGVLGCDAAHWDGVSYQCAEWAGTRCHRMAGKTCSGPVPYFDDGSNGVSMDNLIVQGGEPKDCLGACCLPSGTCETRTRQACATAGGSFQGCGAACEGTTCLGACCQPQGLCTQTLISSCPGAYRGVGSACATANLCCPTPFADWDWDDDLDMADFGALQNCLTSGGGVIGAGCNCFDQNHDNRIDEIDVTSFVECAAGPAMLAGSVPPACAP